jgi:hypothetical protein
MGGSLYFEFYPINDIETDYLFAKPLLHLGHIISYETLDRGLFEVLGP